MQQPARRRFAATDNPPFASPARSGRRLRRLALAVGVAALAAVPAVATASSSGGVGGGAQAGDDGTGATSPAAGCARDQFGRRTLKVGDCGQDVATLNWILKAKHYAAPLHKSFDRTTDSAVRSFQRRADLGADGVVDRSTAKALVRSMPRQRATWYGPGFFGNTTACGQTLTRRTKGVAHRRLPCGTRVVVRYKGRYVRTRVIDRGPFANGAKWDLAQATARQLRFTYTDDVRVAPLAKPRR